MQGDRPDDESVHYENAPIVEAALTIGVHPLSLERYPLLGVVGKHLEKPFSKVRQLEDLAEDSSTVPKGVVGLVFSTEDSRKNIQARSDGFTFSQQAPYDRWETFVGDARSAWEIYKGVLDPLFVCELTVKYVNIIEIPLGIPLHELFNTYPTAPEASTLFSSLSMYYQFEVPELPKARLSVLMVSLGRSQGKGRILLDNTVAVPIPDEATMWTILPRIRKIKNDMFEAQLKPRLKAEYKNA